MIAVLVTARIGRRLRKYARDAVARQAELASVLASKEQLLHGLAHDVKTRWVPSRGTRTCWKPA
jgi:hypothetical protein